MHARFSSRKVHEKFTVKTQHRVFQLQWPMAIDGIDAFRCDARRSLMPLYDAVPWRAFVRHARQRDIWRAFLSYFFSSLVIITRTYAWLKWRCVPVRDWITRVIVCFWIDPTIRNNGDAGTRVGARRSKTTRLLVLKGAH